MTHLRSALLAIFILFLSGCSQRFQDVNSTLDEALFGFDDFTHNREHVAELPYASMYVRINQGPQLFMVLAYAETNPVTDNTQLKWFSNDKAMITTENGRIVKTNRLPGANLVGLSSSTQLAVPTSDTIAWQAEYDWQPGYHFAQRAQVESYPVGTGVTKSLLWKKQTRHIKEVVTFNHSQQVMENNYWIDEQGNVVKSHQQLIPHLLEVEFEVLKPYVE
ncbi:YjbF family lipoprotein [Vibrio sinaloensis]|uniref:YjbF family lipoprotein n=1 Tax=Photobacterium sp. (strain ATCC 43367) TaxID=379097 RepID=UPI002F3E6317